MKRRTLLLGIGTVAGTSGVVGSGAFGNVSASRHTTVAVSPDASAYLTVRGCDGPNGAYVDTEGGTAEIDLTADNTAAIGHGVNPDSESWFHNVFELRNRGTRSVGVWLNVDPASYSGTQAIEFYRADRPATEVVGESNANCLAPGQSLRIGFVVRTNLNGVDDADDLFASLPGENGEAMVVNADADVGCTVPVGGGATAPADLSTGVADWEVTALPPAARGLGRRPPYEAPIVENPPSAWATTNGAEWIDPFDTGGLRDDPAGDDPYVYELVFDGSGTLVVETYGADNPVDLYFDGRRIGGSTGPNAYSPLSTGPTVPGVSAGSHTLRAEVYNDTGSGGNPTGLLIDARLEP